MPLLFFFQKGLLKNVVIKLPNYAYLSYIFTINNIIIIVIIIM